MANNPVPIQNYHEQLIAKCQKDNLEWDFVEGTPTGPAHDRTFSCWYIVNGEKFPEANGKNKKEAKKLAAKNAFELLMARSSNAPQSLIVNDSSKSSNPDLESGDTNYVSRLNEYCLGEGILHQFKEIKQDGPSHLPTFVCCAVVGDKKYKEAEGKNKKAAKQKAAQLALEEMGITPGTIQIVSDSSKSSNPDLENGDTNYIKSLNEYCQRERTAYHFKEIKQDGPSHLPTFVCCAVVGGKEYKEAEGKNKKVAKQKAAQLALEEIGITSCNIRGSSKLEESLKNDQTKCRSKKDIALAPNFSVKPVDKPNQQELDSIEFKEKFQDISELGKGGYGCVFKAKHKVDTKYYAVKKVKLHSGKAVSEVVTLADLNHPNVVRYYTSWQEKAYFYPDLSDTATNSSDNCGILCEALFIQMELCEKGTLKNWIDERRGKDSDKSESLVIFQQIVEGVKYVHSKFLIHRDLKPSNIFLSGEMNIKIGDFGLVTTISIDRDRTKGVGTATYMSPEQKNRSSKYGTEVDIFALGLIFFELLRLYSTDTEKYKDWDRVRNGEFSDDFKAKYPKEVKLLQRMLSETPTTRPLAKDIAQDILSSLTEREPTSVKTC